MIWMVIEVGSWSQSYRITINTIELISYTYSEMYILGGAVGRQTADPDAAHWTSVQRQYWLRYAAAFR